MNPYNEFHQQSINYSLSRIHDKIKGNKAREKLYLMGGMPNILPRPEPQGSFIRMSYGLDRPANFDLSGGFRNQTGQQWGMQQLRKRAEKLNEVNGVVPTDNSTAKADVDTNKYLTEKTELELFFNELSNTTFAGIKLKTSEISEVITNLRKIGLSLNIGSINRYLNIAADSVNQFIQDLANNNDIKYRTRTREVKDDEFIPINWDDNADGTQYNYLQTLENLPTFEFIYRIFLILMVLKNNYNMNPITRKQAFTEEFKNIISAKSSNIYKGDIKDVLELAKKDIKHLKDIVPFSDESIQDFYNSYEKSNADASKAMKNIIKKTLKNPTAPIDEEEIPEVIPEEVPEDYSDEFEEDSEDDAPGGAAELGGCIRRVHQEEQQEGAPRGAASGIP